MTLYCTYVWWMGVLMLHVFRQIESEDNVSVNILPMPVDISVFCELVHRFPLDVAIAVQRPQSWLRGVNYSGLYIPTSSDNNMEILSIMGSYMRYLGVDELRQAMVPWGLLCTSSPSITRPT